MAAYKYIKLENSDSLAAVPAEDYALVAGYRWHLVDGAAACTMIGNDLVEVGVLIERLKGERRLLSGTPWRDGNN
jgi:hypothetical protein